MVSTTPYDGETRTESYPQIRIEFNYPVTAHHIQEYIHMSPLVQGKFSQGYSPKEIIFIPEQIIAGGTRVEVTLKSGLPSDVGKRLLRNYHFSFRISEAGNKMTFTAKGMAGKFMSFDQSIGTSLTVNPGAGIKKPEIRIYKASPELILNSLVYTVENKEYEGSPKNGRYLEKDIDTKELELVREFKDVEYNQKIEFKDDAGIYLMQGLDNGTVVTNAWIALNNIGVHLRQDDESVFLAAQDFDSQNPESDIEVSFYKLLDKPQLLAEHSLGNIQKYPLKFTERLDLVLAKKGNDVMIIPVSIPNSQAEIGLYKDSLKENQIFLYTDRPIYKKGDKVSFRGIVRRDNDGLYTLPEPGTKVRIFIDKYSSGNERKILVDQNLDLKEGGIFSGDFKISDDFDPYTHYLYATTDIKNTSSYQSDYVFFDVFEYVKPEFGLDVDIEKEEYVRGDKIKAKISGSYFSGKPMSNQTVSYSVYKYDYYETEKAVYNSSFNLNSWGGMCGAGSGSSDDWYGYSVIEGKEIKLDQNGKAEIEFNTKELKDIFSQQVTILVQKKYRDLPQESNYVSFENRDKVVAAKNTIVHQGEFNIFFRPGTTNFESDEEFINPFYVENIFGQKLADFKVDYQIYEENYLGNNISNKKVIKKGSVQTDKEGAGIIRDKVSGQDEKALYLELTSKDARGNQVETRKYIYFTKKGENNLNRYLNSETQLKITSNKSNLTAGEQASLEIISPADLTVLATFERGRVYKPQWLNLKKGKNTFEFNVADEFMPSITPTFSFFLDGQYFIEGLSLNVPALQKLVNVEVSLDKPKYNPGDTALVTITTKDNKDNLISADVGLGIVDKAIFAIKKNASKPIHSSFYFYRNRITNSSSSLVWIATYNSGGGGGGGGGGVSFQKDVDTLYWNANLKTGSDGKLTVAVPVGNTQTTWKILTYTSTSDSKFGQAEKDFLVSKQ